MDVRVHNMDAAPNFQSEKESRWTRASVHPILDVRVTLRDQRHYHKHRRKREGPCKSACNSATPKLRQQECRLTIDSRIVWSNSFQKMMFVWWIMTAGVIQRRGGFWQDFVVLSRVTERHFYWSRGSYLHHWLDSYITKSTWLDVLCNSVIVSYLFFFRHWKSVFSRVILAVSLAACNTFTPLHKWSRTGAYRANYLVMNRLVHGDKTCFTERPNAVVDFIHFTIHRSVHTSCIWSSYLDACEYIHNYPQ